MFKYHYLYVMFENPFLFFNQNESAEISHITSIILFGEEQSQTWIFKHHRKINMANFALVTPNYIAQLCANINDKMGERNGGEREGYSPL